MGVKDNEWSLSPRYAKGVLTRQVRRAMGLKDDLRPKGDTVVYLI